MARLGKWAGLLAAVAIAVAAPASAREPDLEGGVKIGRASFVRKLYSAEKLEKTAALQYDQLKGQAQSKHALLPESHPTSQRVKEIARALLPYARKFNDRADKWDWEVNVINSGTVNAFCMPGGKIVVFTGIIDKLKLTDDELAMIIGHEIAHALREHARERAAKGMLTNVGILAVGVLVGNGAGELARVSGGLLGLKFSRGDETESDLVGMELAARAGYDPAAGITLWQKMSALATGAPMEWFSTHPSSSTRVDVIKKNLPDVLPLYEKARARRG
jgi:Zn-dependent protease with chaperone function